MIEKIAACVHECIGKFAPSQHRLSECVCAAPLNTHLVCVMVAVAVRQFAVRLVAEWRPVGVIVHIWGGRVEVDEGAAVCKETSNHKK